MGKIIAMCASKGGVGKTTAAVNLARGLQEHELAVQAVDLDPANRTLSMYPVFCAENIDTTDEDSELPLPPILQLAQNWSSADLVRHASTTDVTVVDMQAGFLKDLGKVCDVADLIIVPTGADMQEFTSARMTVEAVLNYAMSKNPQLAVRILLTRIDPQVPGHTQFIQNLSQMVLPAPVMQTYIPRRQRIQSAIDRGLTVFDYPHARPDRTFFRKMVKECMSILGLEGGR